ncbi:MAG TPA: DUF177 domain-containing protein [Solirubrobacteraceae bacterium]|jgi:uncharacterized protein|nr:DUF177 domain-containing protein [Solirubrobacteraceae bacterium]
MALTHDFDLGRLRLGAGEARRLDLEIGLEDFLLGEQRYAVDPKRLGVVLDVSRMTGHGYSMRLRFTAALSGPCMRCLEPAGPRFDIDSREVDQPGGGEELDSPYVTGEVLDVAGWARDALALTLPTQIVCAADCAGLCPHCGENLNRAGPEHFHEAARDPRWAKLSELRLD